MTISTSLWQFCQTTHAWSLQRSQYRPQRLENSRHSLRASAREGKSDFISSIGIRNGRLLLADLDNRWQREEMNVYEKEQRVMKRIVIMFNKLYENSVGIFGGET